MVAAVRICEGRQRYLLTMRAEEVDGGNLVQALAQAPSVGRVAGVAQRARLARKLVIVGVAGRIEHGAKLCVRHSIHEPRFQDQRLAAACDDFRSQLLKQRACRRAKEARGRRS